MTCAACGRSNRDGARFCDGCGARLADRPEPPPPPPRQLPDALFAHRSVLEGERKHLTVLFADVKGSLALADASGAEDWHAILDRFFQIMTQGIARFEGTVNQYLGDGVMALFGAPIAHEDHLQRGCYAALHLQQQLRRWANELRMSRGLEFSVRMGLNAGEVVVGAIGDPRFRDYTAHGLTVSLAARMEQLAEPGRIYVPGHLAKVVQGYFTFEDIGTFDVKGLPEPVHVCELTGLGPLRTRFERSQARGLSKFVGRARELATLEAAFTDVQAGRGAVVSVAGDPGAGKSRLCFEFVERRRGLGTPVREAHGVSHGRLVPFLPIAELLRGYFDVSEHEPPRTARNKIAGALLLLDRTLEPALPAVFDLLGIGEPERGSSPGGGERRDRVLLDVVRRLIRGTTTPGIIVVEDLHWIDPATEAFLTAIIEVCLDTPTLLLVNHRPEYRPPWTERPYARSITLAPLTAEAQAVLIADLIGTDSSLGDFPGRLRERTRGNPFFLEEVVQSLVERGLLVGRRGAYELVDAATSIAIPDSLHAVLSARIDRLDDTAKHVLQSAAVIGKRVRESEVQAVAEVDPAAASGALVRLAAAGFLDADPLAADAEYSFRHPFTRDVAYGSQLGDRRARRHGRAAAAILATDPERHGERAALIAHHWEHAGEPAKAARAYRRAAERAGLGHAAESFAHWSKVRELAAAAPRTTETDEDGAAACAQLLLVGARIGFPAADIDALFGDGMALAERSGNLDARVRLLAAYGGHCLLGRCDFETARPRVEEAWTLGAGCGQTTQIMAGLLRGQVLAWGGHFAEALDGIEHTLALCGNDWVIGSELIGYSPRFALGFYHVVALVYLGRTAAARALADGLLGWALATDERFLHCSALSLAALVASLDGNEPVALGHARRAVSLAEQTDLAGLRLLAHRELGRALVQTDAFTEALPVLEHAVTLLRAFDTYRVVEPQLRGHLAETLAGLGRAEAARAEAERAVAAAAAGGPHMLTEALLARARVLLTLDGAGAADEAGALVARAVVLARRHGAVRTDPVLTLERARIARLAGDTATATRLIDEARARYTALDLPRLAARPTRW